MKRKKKPIHKKKPRTALDSLLTFVVVAGLSTTTALVLNEVDSVNQVDEASTALTLENVSAQSIAENKEAEVSYDYSDIKQVTAENIEEALESVNIYDLPVIGGMAIPDIGLNLPIINGVTDAGMFTGATTLQPEQQLGKGNYPLASHRSIYEDLLFGPLPNSEVGMSIYISDLDTVYEYTVVSNEVVAPDTIEVLNPTETPTITMITCTIDGEDRVIVRGELSQQWDVESAPDEVLEALSIDPTNQFGEAFDERYGE